ncbi:nuclear transport factor 2 family protein [Arthrobacter sp. NPDC057013]|uniref:nuclear transport factor 2 family protein n=1 Tax=Arthrobacter sp. NPDC057013 TaxID=3345999 RepID=UPI0036456283
MRATAETAKVLTHYYAAMEANNPSEFGSYYAENMTLTFGNSPEIKGRHNIIAAFSDKLNEVESLGHDLVNVWEEEGGVVFFESIGRWTLRNGAVIEIKAASKITMVDGKFVDQRIYVDNAPVSEALENEKRLAGGA